MSPHEITGFGMWITMAGIAAGIYGYLGGPPALIAISSFVSILLGLIMLVLAKAG